MTASPTLPGSIPRDRIVGGHDAAARVVAVLGPTNTGKTFLAMERMLGHRTGMIGFPLRLLARENYDKVVKAKGRKAVALVTGEEKIVPANPQYWVCTVESMPLDRPVQFLCVDEIQLCADPERGHIFTDRLLHARGTAETMFLGSDTIRPLLQKLVPRAEYISRPRFSRLAFAGHKKLARLPPRSAIVAFNTTDVYSLAEMVRRTRGGTAVVLGALSPRTRNAQVALYQSGDVDYLVATDAIGMGLNMDVDHVWFARLSKFDGIQPRRLKHTEVAQIAGRAGRHTSDGQFGTTWDCPALDEETVEAVETHSFPSLSALMWRNADLDFRSLAHLQRSLDARPPTPELIRARDADDQQALLALSQEQDIAAACTDRRTVALLWEVCQVPDFRKVLSDQHVKLLGQLFRYLSAPPGRLPEDFIAGQLGRLDRTEGDIDALVARIAHVRTWTYVSHRADWLADPAAWQERSRAIEDKLSDALHERLTQRFVDKRSAGLVKSLRGGKDLLGAVSRSGTVTVEGHPVGELEGLRFTLDAAVQPEDQRALMTAARRALKDEIGARVGRIAQAPDAEFRLAPDGTIAWGDAALGKLVPGPSVLLPLVRPLHDDLLEAPPARPGAPAPAGLGAGPCGGEAGAPAAAGTGRAVRPRPRHRLPAGRSAGALPRPALDPLIADLTKEQRRQLAGLGVRLGFSHVFLPQLAKPKAVALRALLWAVRHGHPVPAPVPPPGRVSLPAGDLPEGLADALGYPPVGPRAIRVDILDRLEQELAARGKAGPIARVDDLPQLLGCPAEDLPGILGALGWRPKTVPTPLADAARATTIAATSDAPTDTEAIEAVGIAPPGTSPEGTVQAATAQVWVRRPRRPGGQPDRSRQRHRPAAPPNPGHPVAASPAPARKAEDSDHPFAALRALSRAR